MKQFKFETFQLKFQQKNVLKNYELLFFIKYPIKNLITFGCTYLIKFVKKKKNSLILFSFLIQIPFISNWLCLKIV